MGITQTPILRVVKVERCWQSLGMTAQPGKKSVIEITWTSDEWADPGVTQEDAWVLSRPFQTYFPWLCVPGISV